MQKLLFSLKSLQKSDRGAKQVKSSDWDSPYRKSNKKWQKNTNASF
jgi:hypothetical protein